MTIICHGAHIGIVIGIGFVPKKVDTCVKFLAGFFMPIFCGGFECFCGHGAAMRLVHSVYK